MNIMNKFSEKNNVISVSKKDENKFDNININFIDVDAKQKCEKRVWLYML